MLVLTRKKGESIVISNDIVITVLAVEGDVIKVGISAPKEVDIYRKEVFEAIQQNNQGAAIGKEAINHVMLDLSKGV